MQVSHVEALARQLCHGQRGYGGGGNEANLETIVSLHRSKGMNFSLFILLVINDS